MTNYVNNLTYLLIQTEQDNIFLKQNAAKELGYKYEIWFYNQKRICVEKHI